MLNDALKRVFYIVMCAGSLLALSATDALADDHKKLTLDKAWQNHVAGKQAHQLSEKHRVFLAEPGKWTAQEVQDLLLGAQALPAFMSKATHDVTFKRVRRSCLYGMGRYNKRCPTFQDNQQTFYIYDTPPIQGEGATRKLRALNQKERTSIQRQRAVVHALVYLYDVKHDWSGDKRWKLINTWKGKQEQPFNLDIWGYSRYLGIRSARLDLVTFAEEYFVRPEDILRQGLTKDPKNQARIDKFDVNLSLSCQQFTKIRHFQEAIAKRDPKWQEPKRGLALKKNYKQDKNKLKTQFKHGPSSQCPEFERWADMNNVEGIDLMLAAATSDRPESLYGHLLLAVRYKSGSSVRSQGFQPVYQYGAITATNVSKVDYFTKGLFGGFYAVIQPNTFRGIDRLFLQYEQRTLRRYALNLSPNELRRAMERLWEAERHITYPYYFLSDNCASMLIDLMAPAIDATLPEPLRAGMMPTEVLDLFASVKNKNRGPLLVKRAETHFSSREVAMSAVPKRRAKLKSILTKLKVNDKKAIDQLSKLDNQLDERESKKRQKAYERIQKLLTTLLNAHFKANPKATRIGSKSITRDVIDYLYYSTRIERYFMDLAFYQRRMIYVGAHKKPFIMTAEQQLEMRRKLFEEEDLLARQEAILAWARMGDARVRNAERRPFTKEEKQKLAKIEQTRSAYLASLDTLATIIETFEPDMDGVKYIDDKLTAFKKDQDRRDRLSMGPPGKGRYIIGGSIAQQGKDFSGAPVGWMDINLSLVYERLGEQRRRGFRSDIESRALGLDVSLRLDDKLLDELQIDAVLFRFITIEQRMGPVQRSWRDNFGWATDIRAKHDGRRDLSFGLQAELGYVYPIWQKDNVANFIVAGLFADARTHWGNSRSPDFIGLNAQLLGQFHLYGRYANVLRFKLKTSHLGAVDELGYDWDASLHINTEHILADVNQQLLLLKPYIRGEWTSMTYRPGEDQFMQWKAGAMIELPF